jgi:hypothetical protein
MLMLLFLIAVGTVPLAAQEPAPGGGTTSSPVSEPRVEVVPPVVVSAPVEVPERAPQATPATTSPVSVVPESVTGGTVVRGELSTEPIPPVAPVQIGLPGPAVNAPATLAPRYTPPTQPVPAQAVPGRG